MTPITCPVCGGTLFCRIEGGSYTEEHYIDTIEETQWTEDQDQSRDDFLDWECRSGCGTKLEARLYPEITDALDEAEEKLEWRI